MECAAHSPTAAEAEPVLARLLQERALYEGYEQGLWIAGIGRSAVLAPNSEFGPRAIAELTRLSSGEDHSLAVAAIAALARIAAAAPNGSLAEGWLAALRAEFARVQQEVGVGEWYEDGDDPPVLEPLVELARVPRFVMQRAELEPLLARIANDSEQWWIRDWAQRQLARLP